MGPPLSELEELSKPGQLPFASHAILMIAGTKPEFVTSVTLVP